MPGRDQGKLHNMRGSEVPMVAPPGEPGKPRDMRESGIHTVATPRQMRPLAFIPIILEGCPPGGEANSRPHIRQFSPYLGIHKSPGGACE
jgi:hypothetical protein